MNRLIIIILCSLSVNNNFSQNISFTQIGTFGSTEKNNELFFSNYISWESSNCINISNNIKNLYIHRFYSKMSFVIECYVNKKFKDNKLTIIGFPNPANNFYTMKIMDDISLNDNLKYDTEINMQIINSNGQIIKNFKSTLNNLINGYKIDLSFISNNIYFIKFSGHNINIQSIKFIKTN